MNKSYVTVVYTNEHILYIIPLRHKNQEIISSKPTDRAMLGRPHFPFGSWATAEPPSTESMPRWKTQAVHCDGSVTRVRFLGWRCRLPSFLSLWTWVSERCLLCMNWMNFCFFYGLGFLAQVTFSPCFWLCLSSAFLVLGHSKSINLVPG